jgi:hypothetical protein
MTDRYYRNQSRFKGLACDTPTMRAAVNLVIAVKDGHQPDTECLNLLADAFLEVFGGKNPKDIFGGTLGLVPTPGGQRHYGFIPEEVVSAYIELKRRSLGGGRGAISAAMSAAVSAFVDIGGKDVIRSIKRDWKIGRSSVEGLSDADLTWLLQPYKW